MSLPALTALFALAQSRASPARCPRGLGVFETIILPRSPACPRPRGGRAARLPARLLPAALHRGGAAAGGPRDGAAPSAPDPGGEAVQDSLAPVVPWIASAVAFVAGAVLLFSGATPAVAERLAVRAGSSRCRSWRRRTCWAAWPACRCWCSRGLQRRLDGAYVLTEVALVAGAMFSARQGRGLRGGDAAAGVLALRWCPSAAVPPARVAARGRLQPGVAPGRGGGGGRVGVDWGLLTTGTSEYSHDATGGSPPFGGDAPRFLRATRGRAGRDGGGRRLAALLRPASARTRRRTRRRGRAIRPLVTHAPVRASLALVGDKSLLLNDRGSGVPHVRRVRARWVSMGDPVGPPDEATELAWRFQRAGGPAPWPGVLLPGGREDAAPLPGLGADAAEAGQEAAGAPGGLQPGGPERRGLRHGVHSMEREGLDLRGAAARGGAQPLLPRAAGPLRRVARGEARA